MAVTVTTAAERDRRVARRALVRPSLTDVLLVATSLAAAIAIAITYAGRIAVLTRHAPAAGAPRIVNLNTMADAAGLEAVLRISVADPGERRFIAAELFRFIVPSGGPRRTLPNVGAISRGEVSVATLLREPLPALRQRALAAQARAAAAGQPPPDTIALLTSADVAAIKPYLTVRDRGTAAGAVVVWTALYLAAFVMAALVWRLTGRRGDMILLASAHLLTAIGFVAMLARPDLLRDTLLVQRYAQGVIAGVLVMTAASFIDLRKAVFRDLSYLPLAGALLLSLLLIVFGTGPSGSGAKVNLGPVQPVEAIRLLIALFLAGYFGRRWELIRTAREVAVRGYSLPRWISAPRMDDVLPLVIGVLAALGLFFIQRDLGPALLVAAVFLVMYAVARAGVVLTAAGFGLLAAGFYVGYALRISSTLTERVRMWQSPWDNAARGGDQIAQALWALASGGGVGFGAGLGDTRYLPAGHTDLVLASVAEELGFAGLIVVAVAFAALVWRAMRVARRAASDYAFFLALALTLFLVVPVLLMLAGTLGVVPLTGVVTPFLSYGGSAMVANFLSIGLLVAVARERQSGSDLSCFLPALRWTGAGVGLTALLLLLLAGRVQVLRADEIAVRPHLGLQADGSRRFQYNPRVLDVARQIPRGTIYDRRGVPLASDDESVVRKAGADFQRLGISIERTCPDFNMRCYPLGGLTFHLLGDARTRARWSASNTSFVERDAEARLRGFDDHQTLVRTADGAGGQAMALRRDYREVLPLLRHRYEPDHSEVRALLAQPRDIRLTVDAALQVRVAAIVAAHARRSSGRAAAVVLDPATGDLLASVSYPWPSDDISETIPGVEEAADELFDRARYGIYPPGSTFKLVAAAAALQRDPGSHETRFVCSRLSDGRVGARIPGWGRPVRDDVLDRHPHGSVNMHEAMVVSCNAYFAQLAVRVGPDALLESARRVDIPIAKPNTAVRARQALPQVGYGQAEVLSTPLRMARVAAAIAADGIVSDVRWDSRGGTTERHRFVTADAARLLGRYMRDAVLRGTGRRLRDHRVPIAGKTGTAEVAGSASHSWFAGYAPYGPASKRIAVAVIVENAGYGGATAAPAAGEIITAAAQVGLVR